MGSSTTDRRLGLVGDKGMKAPVALATTANITLSGEQSIDGVTTSASRVLVKNQTNAKENGIYISNTGTWTRDLDANGNLDLVTGTMVCVTGGSTQSRTFWQITTTGSISIGSTSITWAICLTAVDLQAPAGSSFVGFLQSGTGAVNSTVQTKLRESVSVLDFGAVGDGVTDSLAAFNLAISALSASGGEIHIPSGAWFLSAAPTEGTRSVTWDINPGATFSGAGVGAAKFLSMASNSNHLAAGVLIRSRSSLASPAFGGISALSVDMDQPTAYVGNSVAVFGGARTASATGIVWGGNFLARGLAGSGGTVYGLEVDVDVQSASVGSKGIQLNGEGTSPAGTGLEIIRNDYTSNWGKGIYMRDVTRGIQIERVNGAGTQVLDIGILIGNGPLTPNTALSASQLLNGADAILLARFDDAAPSGYFIRGVNTAVSGTLFSIDVGGNYVGGSITMASPAGATGAGRVSIGNEITATATAGGNTLPAQPYGFMSAYLAGVKVKIPLYLN